MTRWLNAFIAALKRLTLSAYPASTAAYQQKSAAEWASALNMKQTPLPAVTPRLAPVEAIRARSSQERRNRKQAAAYIAKNTSLIQHKER
jgi:hypothetical protein